MAAAPTITEIDTDVLLNIQGVAATDGPFTSAQRLIMYNDAYQEMWQRSRGRVKKATSGTAWSVATTTTSGVMTGALDNVEEILQAWFTASSGSSGGVEGTDFTIREVEMPEIEFYRGRNAAQGTYGTIQMYAVSRLQTATGADRNKMQLDFWPAIASLYIPIKYVPQFTPFAAIDSTIPELTDYEARDLTYIAAAWMAPLNARWDLVNGLVQRVSVANRDIAERQANSLEYAKQNRVP